MYDGHEIFREFLFSGTYLLILDHEMGVVLVAYPFKQLEREATEPVAVGYHNFFDASVQDGVHHS